MYGFLLLIGLLGINILACGGLFFAGNTGPVVPLAVSFFLLYGLAAFRAGRGVEFRSPIAPRGLPRPVNPAKRRPAPQRQTADQDFGVLE